MNEETINHLLGKATVLSVNLYPPNSLHVIFESGAMLTVNWRDDGLDIDVLGPDAPMPGDRFEIACPVCRLPETEGEHTDECHCWDDGQRAGLATAGVER